MDKEECKRKDKRNQEWSDGKYKNTKKEKDVLVDEKHGGEEWGKVEWNSKKVNENKQEYMKRKNE